MNVRPCIELEKSDIKIQEIKQVLEESLKQCFNKLCRVLIIPPDYTRSHSKAGIITSIYYDILKDLCEVDIMPALGTHKPMTEKECIDFFGADIPNDKYLVHNWRDDVVKIGTVPSDYVSEVSNGVMVEDIDVEVNERIVNKKYDLIISIGQVVPHEVVGMANYSKNIFVGCGGSNMINSTHMLGASYGMEKIMGRDNSPVRKVFDYAEKHFLKDIPLIYVLTVVEQNKLKGLYVGRDRSIFESAVERSRECNIFYLEKKVKKVVVYLDELEFKSTWLGNKAVYRTRMAIEDNGELVVLAPGIKVFGEDTENDKLIRKYGYCGRTEVLKLINNNEDLNANRSAAAHLIHGSSDCRFTITYAVQYLDESAVKGVNYNYMNYNDAIKKYDPKKMQDGYNVIDGEEVYYISNPALGLWMVRE